MSKETRFEALAVGQVDEALPPRGDCQSLIPPTPRGNAALFMLLGWGSGSLSCIRLGSGIDKDRPDYTVVTGEWEVGRIYEHAAVPTICAGSGR